MPNNHVCEHCKKFVYQVFNGRTELAHLLLCEAYQSLPVAFVRADGKEFYQDKKNLNLLIEIVRPEN